MERDGGSVRQPEGRRVKTRKRVDKTGRGKTRSSRGESKGKRLQQPYLTGDRVYLRTLEPGDVNEAYLSWLNDPEVTRFLQTGASPATLASLRRYVGQLAQSPDTILLAIAEKDTSRHVGNIKLGPIHRIHRRADLGIMIGDKARWGLGYAQEAVGLLLDHAFNRLNLHKVTLGVDAGHGQAVRLYRDLGFRIEGTQREQLFREGKYRDNIVMGLLRDDYRQPVKADAIKPAEFSARAHRVIPGGAHTYSKGDDILPVNAPQAFVRGKGARVWTLDGRELVDWGMGINSVLIGHAEDEIDDAAIAALRDGQNFSRPSPPEVELAEAVVALFDGMEMVKFAKNGSDANDAAIRLARAVTGRTLIAYDQDAPFLSIHDWFIGHTVMNAGVPEAVTALTVGFRYNDPASVEAMFAEHGTKLAAVIMEPCREVRPVPGFLEKVRALCDRHGVLLIFDEMVTGFRYSLHGAASFLRVTPDLMTVGKGMANGYALSALLGRREYMERGGLQHSHPRCFLLSTTHGAERSALAAGLAAVRFHRRHGVVERLAEAGRRLIAGVESAAKRHGIESYVSAASDFPCRPALKCGGPDNTPSAEYRTLFIQEMLRRGVFMPWICPSFRHEDAELDQTLEALDDACSVYAKALEQRNVAGFLDGRPAKPVFRKLN
jgi:glutamate-1-semialdehyde 2,1-aminomutase